MLSSTKPNDLVVNVKRETTGLTFKSDVYKVCNIIDRDIYCDLHVIGVDFLQNKLLIPIDKQVVIQHLPYFENMFREGSNWIEGKQIETTNSGVTETIVKVDNLEQRFPCS